MSVASKPRICGFPLNRYPWYVRLILMLQRHCSSAKLDALSQYDGSPLFTGRKRATLACAEAVTDPACRVDDAFFARLRQHFTNQEIMELTALIAYQNMSSKFNSALSIPAQGFCANHPNSEVQS